MLNRLLKRKEQCDRRAFPRRGDRAARERILAFAGLGGRPGFSGLRGEEIPEPLDPADFDDREVLRAHWDRIEQDMRAYLDGLRDEMLFEKPFAEGEDQDLFAWQVLLHVVNHGTDHRAQTLRLLNDLGVRTTSQDYIFYVYDHP